MIRAVVFDLFDTLVDLRMERIPPIVHAGRRVAGTARLLHTAFSERVDDVAFDHFVEVLGQVDSEFRKTRYDEGLELPTGERFEMFLERLDASDAALLETLVGVHMGALREQVRVLDHHVDVLAALRERVPLALCSNFSHSETAMHVLDQARLTGFLDVVGVSDAIGIRKPRPEIFEWVLAQLELAPDEILHVGDNLAADVGGAAALGIATAWITRRVPEPEARLAEHEGPDPDYVIQDLSELVPLVESLT